MITFSWACFFGAVMVGIADNSYRSLAISVQAKVGRLGPLDRAKTPAAGCNRLQGSLLSRNLTVSDLLIDNPPPFSLNISGIFTGTGLGKAF